MRESKLVCCFCASCVSVWWKSRVVVCVVSLCVFGRQQHASRRGDDVYKAQPLHGFQHYSPVGCVLQTYQLPVPVSSASISSADCISIYSVVCVFRPEQPYKHSVFSAFVAGVSIFLCRKEFFKKKTPPPHRYLNEYITCAEPVEKAQIPQQCPVRFLRTLLPLCRRARNEYLCDLKLKCVVLEWGG